MATSFEVERALRELRPMIRQVANATRFQMYVDDLVAVGMAAAWEMMAAGAGPRPECYGLFVRRARWAMFDYLRHMRPGKRRNPAEVLSIDLLVKDSDEGGMAFQLTSLDPRPDDMLDEVRRRRKLTAAIARLSPRMRFVATGIIAGRLASDIAADLNVTEARISQLKKVITNKLRRRLLPPPPP